MSSGWFSSGLLPENFPSGWRLEAARYNGRLAVTARRTGTGVTCILTQDGDGWWHVSKIKGGQIIATRVTKQLPLRVRSAIEAARKNQHERRAA